jgi:hypothetical protein
LYFSPSTQICVGSTIKDFRKNPEIFVLILVYRKGTKEAKDAFAVIPI